MTWGKRFVQKYIWKGKTFEETYALNPPKSYKEGRLQDKPQRKYLCLVDALIAGEGEGPLANTPKEVGVVFGGMNPVMVDYAAASVMNFDYRLLPMIMQSFKSHKYPLISIRPEDIQIGCNVSHHEYCQDFVPTSGWKVLYQSYQS